VLLIARKKPVAERDLGAKLACIGEPRGAHAFRVTP
jgi:hypothetical protein